jgi:hypothetical protein
MWNSVDRFSKIQKINSHENLLAYSSCRINHLHVFYFLDDGDPQVLFVYPRICIVNKNDHTHAAFYPPLDQDRWLMDWFVSHRLQQFLLEYIDNPDQYLIPTEHFWYCITSIWSKSPVRMHHAPIISDRTWLDHVLLKFCMWILCDAIIKKKCKRCC